MGKGSTLDLCLFLPSDLGYSLDCEEEKGGRGQMGNGTYTSLFFHSFLLRASQSPHPLYRWLSHPWDAPGTPRSLGRPRNTEIYDTVEEGVSSE